MVLVVGSCFQFQHTSTQLARTKSSLSFSLIDTLAKPVGSAIDNEDHNAALTILLKNAELEKKLSVAEKEIEIAKTEKNLAQELLHLKGEMFEVRLKYEKEKSVNAVKALFDSVYTYSARGIIEFYNEIVLSEFVGSREDKWKAYLSTASGMALHKCMAAHNKHFSNPERLIKYIEGLWATMCDHHHLTKLDIRDGKRIVIAHSLPTSWKDMMVCLCETAPVPIKYRITKPGEEMLYEEDMDGELPLGMITGVPNELKIDGVPDELPLGMITGVPNELKTDGVPDELPLGMITGVPNELKIDGVPDELPLGKITGVPNELKIDGVPDELPLGMITGVPEKLPAGKLDAELDLDADICE